MTLFRRRRQEHRHDQDVRQDTADVLKRHREASYSVRSALQHTQVRLSLMDEIRGLEDALERGAQS